MLIALSATLDHHLAANTYSVLTQSFGLHCFGAHEKFALLTI